MAGSQLPLSGPQEPTHGIDREAEIAELVDRFYAAARQDEILGPVFEGNVSDWRTHLATMRDFWSSALYRTGRYSGRPLEVHRKITEIRGEHFHRWLDIWKRTVDTVVTSDARAPLKELASRMAATMSARMGPAPSRNVS